MGAYRGNTHKIAVLFFAVFSSAVFIDSARGEASEQKKVKIIFNYGAPSTATPSGDVVYDLRTQQAKELYERAGYKVVVLATGPNGNYPPTASGLRQAFETELGKGDVEELSIGFFGHGDNLFPSQIQALPKNKKIEFPLTRQPKDLLGIDGWGNRGAESMAFAISSPLGTEAVSTNHVGLGLLKNLLADAKKKNPALQTTVTALNCHSGMIGLELAKEPGFNSYMSTFSSTTARSVAPDPTADKLDSSKDVDYPFFLNQYLASGMSYREAHAKAAHDLLELSKKHGDRIPYATIPRSQIQQFVTRWCMENKGKQKVYPDAGSVQLSGDFQLAFNDLTQSVGEVSSHLEGQAKATGCYDKSTLTTYRRFQKEADDLIRGIYKQQIDSLLVRANTLNPTGYFKSNLAREQQYLKGGLVDTQKMPVAKSKLVSDLTALAAKTHSLSLDNLALAVEKFDFLLSPMKIGGPLDSPLPPRISSHKCEKGNEISSSSAATEIIEKVTRVLACLKTEPPTATTQGVASWIKTLEDDLCKRPAPLLNSLQQDQACVRTFFASVGKDDPAMKRLMEIFRMSQRGLFSGGDLRPIENPGGSHPATSAAAGVGEQK